MVLKIPLVGFLSALLGAFAGGFTVYVLMDRWKAATPVDAGRVRVTELTLIDGQKRPAAKLAVEDGATVLRFLREDSKESVSLRAWRMGPAIEVLAFGGDNGESGRVVLSTSPYGTELGMGGPVSGPRITLGAEEPSDIPTSAPAHEWGLFFSDSHSATRFKQPDPHYPIWVRENPGSKR